MFFKLEIILTGETLPRVTNSELNERIDEQKQTKLMTMKGLLHRDEVHTQDQTYLWQTEHVQMSSK